MIALVLPLLILCAAIMTVFIPDAHTLFTVVAGVVFGRPAKISAWVDGACPWPACSTLPMYTSSIASFGIPVFLVNKLWNNLSARMKDKILPALSTVSLITAAPSLAADTDANEPRNEPIGVLTALTMNTSFLVADEAWRMPVFLESFVVLISS